MLKFKYSLQLHFNENINKKEIEDIKNYIKKIDKEIYCKYNIHSMIMKFDITDILYKSIIYDIPIFQIIDKEITAYAIINNIDENIEILKETIRTKKNLYNLEIDSDFMIEIIKFKNILDIISHSYKNEKTKSISCRIVPVKQTRRDNAKY